MKKTNIKIASRMIEQPAVYGPPSEQVYTNESTIQQAAIYGPPPEKENLPLKATNVGILIVLFVLGIIALVNKKLSKTAKAIIITSIVVIGIVITVIIMNVSKL